MNDVIQDLCTNLLGYESALVSMRAAGKSGASQEMVRMTRNVELCERWLRVAGGEEALARMRAGSPTGMPPRYRS